jgi:hypothetical protein
MICSGVRTIGNRCVPAVTQGRLHWRMDDGGESVEIVSAKDIVVEMERRIEMFESITDEYIKGTLGARSGMDMKTYNRGYLDALRQLKGYFETRV